MVVHARRFALAALVLGSALVAAPAAAQSDTVVTTRTEEEDDSDFPWGLLGLLGLAGLIPRGRKEVHVHEHDVHTRTVPPRDDRVGTPPPPPPRP